MKHQLVSRGSSSEPVIGFFRAVRVGDVVYADGTVPIAADGKTATPGDAAGRIRRCFEIIKNGTREGRSRPERRRALADYA